MQKAKGRELSAVSGRLSVSVRREAMGVICFCTLAFAFIFAPMAQSSEWLEKAGLPHPRALHMVAATGNGPERCYFVFGGKRSVHSTMEQTCLKYSAVSNSWSERTPMRYRRGIGRAVPVRNLIYVLGGCETFGIGLPNVEVYDPAADQWERAPNMPESLHDFGAAVWRDSLIYILGGGNWSPGSRPTDHVWLFDPATDTWNSATPLPVPTGALCSEIIGDTIIITTGWTDSGAVNSTWQGTINPEHPAEILWARLDTLPGTARYRAASGTVHGRMYVIGGILKSGGVCGETWLLDPVSGTWQQLASKPHPAADVHGTALIGDRLYVPGGYPGTAPYLKTNEALNTGHYDHDVGINCIVSPVGRLVPGIDHPVAASIQSFGSFPVTFYTRACVTDSLSQQLVFESDTILSLAPGESTTVQFGRFIPSSARVFKVSAFTYSPGDENPDNDTGRARCRTTSGSEPDGYGYIYISSQEPDTISFSWLDPTSGDTITDWEPDPDDGISERDLPFPFPFYGDTLEQLHVCTNGFLETSDLTCHINCNLPFYDMTDIIAPFWDDLTLREAGTVLEKQYPDKVAYTWIEVPRYGAANELMTFQTVLYQDGGIGFNYLCLDGDRTSSTIGIQGRDGSQRWYLEYVYDGEPNYHIPADSVTILFRPPGVGIYERKPGPSPTPSISVNCPTIWSGANIPVEVSWRAGRTPRVDLFDACGRIVAAMRPEPTGACVLRLVLPGENSSRLTPGAYFLRVANRHAGVVRKLVLLD